ncbi:MAG: outer membrane protein assembly factor [Cardiobacteriaceae bacterium]|nr:outer membrane protein assembly factor [Cardiobacteriaceae bacterium]
MNRNIFKITKKPTLLALSFAACFAYSENIFTLDTSTQYSTQVINNDNPITSENSDNAENGALAAIPDGSIDPKLAELQGKKIHKIDIIGIKDKEQLNNAEVFLSLTRVKNEVIEQPDYVNWLIENGINEIAESQQPFGFYETEVKVEKKQEKEGLRVIYTVKQNQPTKIRAIDVKITGEALSDPEFQKILAANPFRKGQVLNHKQYEEYKGKFLEAAVTRGYFDGNFTEKLVEVVPEDHSADIKLHYESGKRFTFDTVTFSRSDNKDEPLPLNDDLLQRFVQFQKGQVYSSQDIEKLQQDLQASGYFKQVTVGPRPKRDDKTVPVSTQVVMNKNKHYAFGVGYSTDSGVRGKFDFDRRWVNRRGHNFSTELFLSQKNSSWHNMYRIPARNPATDYYYFSFGGDIKNDDYDSRRYFAEGGYNWRRKNWDYRVSLTSAWEKFTIGLDSDEILLTYPTLQATYTSTENRLNPDSGYQVRANVLGGGKGVGSDISFVQSNLRARYLKSFNPKNRVVFRFDSGATWTDDYHRLPASMRFFAGGDRSIRGYSYEKLGHYDKSNTNVGGKYLAVAGAEYEYYFKPQWAAAFFVDGGDAFNRKFEPKFGAGVGLHWKSPVGPIKIDLGHGFDEDLGDKIRLHLSVGAELDL